MNIDPTKYRQAFFDESSEHLSVLEASLLRLEVSPNDQDAIGEAFRAVHSIKGGADAVGMPSIAEFTHALENILDQFRSEAGVVPSRFTDLLLRANDTLGGLLRSGKSGGTSPPGAKALLDQLRKAIEPTSAEKPIEYAIRIKAHADAVNNGLRPGLLIRDLGRLGVISEVCPSLACLDVLGDMSVPPGAEEVWSLRLTTTHSPNEIKAVFDFAGDNLEVSIEPVTQEKQVVGNPQYSVLDVREPVQFGSFLVRRGLLTADQVLEAVDRQNSLRPFLGRLAIEEGRLSVRQLFDTLKQMQPCDRFDETVVRLGHLTQADLGHLYTLQSKRVPSLDKILVSMGAVNRETVKAELGNFLTDTSAAADLDNGVDDQASTIPNIQVIAPSASFLTENLELFGEFCTEADEHLESADRYLLAIDTNPTDREALDAVYRGFHTIKGAASMLNVDAVRVLAHEAESLLNQAREETIVLKGALLDLVFTCVDSLKRQLGFLRRWVSERGVIEQDPALPGLLIAVRNAATGKKAAVPTPVVEPEPKPAAQIQKPRPAAPKMLGTPKPQVPDEPAAKAEASPVPHAIVERPVASDHGPASTKSVESDTVRVDRNRLDKLINAIGELVIVQAMVQQEMDVHLQESGDVSQAIPELNKISRDLQELGLSLRMVPLQGTFQKMTRLVRDLSNKMGKPVHFETVGEETELDKTVVDRLGDPLMHMVRNAIDHGLESPDGRIAANKPREGRLTLKAFYQGGSVYIELSDDGRGLDREAILRKAIERGIVSESQRLSDAEVYALIFEAGFSTAKAVTDVSGRGVGMDVVRRNVEAMQGNILIRTQLGKGTTFTIRLPLTLAIMDGLTVGLGDDVYVLPLLSVIESFRPVQSDVHVLAGRGEVIAVRGETVPLLRLHRLLNRPARCTHPSEGLVVLVEDEGKKYALLVDELVGQIQAVVKSLDLNFRRVEGLAGATVLGDGRVAMIVDVHGLTRLSGRGGPVLNLTPLQPFEALEAIAT